MADKKLTTAEILALAKKQGAQGDGGGDSTPPTTESAAPETPVAEAPAPAKPTSTADILAAARAQKAAKSADESAEPAKPTSTADILAAARAQKGGATKPAAAAPKSTADILAAARAGKAAAAKPAAGEKKPAAKTAPVKDLGDKPAVKDMVAAMKQSQATGVPPKLPSKPVPTKPKLPAKKTTSRRRFLEALSALAITPFAVGWAAVGGIGTLWSLGIARFMMPNMVLELPSQFKVGLPSDFPPGVVSEKFKASRGVWIVNTDQYGGKGIIYALLSICTHLGCTPNWLAGEQKFKCPCHGSGFYITGINFEGPAPRPLERVGLRIAEDGSLEVDKSLKFQEELGQWSDPKSFVETV